ncbi:zinc ribbon domain-containing protein [uncultured Veillonella sp.]|uniref:zinc ribbon domain-containing protein n=1 Tax=uncultured Veillonella sp. TaxID=159268 RepID=UPI0026157741|nr:zinc-ribbon domain-containing protein [uncultured Veillonella sp.]
MNRTAKFCTSCGTPIKQGSQFCTGCGKRLVADPVVNHMANQGAMPANGGTPAGGFTQVASPVNSGVLTRMAPPPMASANPTLSAQGAMPMRAALSNSGAVPNGAPVSTGRPHMGTMSQGHAPTEGLSAVGTAERILLEHRSLPEYREALRLLGNADTHDVKASLLLTLAHLYESIDSIQRAIQQVDAATALNGRAINSFGGTGRMAMGTQQAGQNFGTAAPGSASLANQAASGSASNWGQAVVAGAAAGVASGVVRDMLHDGGSGYSVSHTVSDTLDDVGNTLADASGAVFGTTELVGDTVADTADGVVDMVADATESAGDYLSDAAESIGDTMDDVFDDAEDMLADASDMVEDVLDDATDAVEDLADEVLDGDTLSDAGDALGDFFSDLFS